MSPSTEKKSIRNKAWYLKNREKRRVYLKKWRENNKDWFRTWKEQNLSKMRHLWRRGCHKRRLFKKLATGSHSLGEWERLKAQYNWTCPCCGLAEPDIKLTEDHIIPLSKGGSDNIENIQPLCRPCNSKKNTKIIHFSLDGEKCGILIK